MIKGSAILSIILLIITVNLSGQQLSHQVMVPAAGLVVKGIYNYQQTVGETAIEIFTKSPYVITQGFQQPGFRKPEGGGNNGNGVEVYPNPARDFIDIELFGTDPRKFTIEIISFTGMLVKNATIEFSTSFDYIQRLEISHFMRGFYFVRIISTDGVINRTFKLEKI
jgi:hypothetical protein